MIKLTGSLIHFRQNLFWNSRNQTTQQQGKTFSHFLASLHHLFVVQRLRAIPGVKCAEPRGAFYAYPNIRVALAGGNTLQFAERVLAESKVAVVPGEAFGTDQHVRISYATSMHELERGLERLDQFIRKYS